MTFKDLVDDALEELGYDPNVPYSTARTRLKKRLNTWHKQLLSRPGFNRLLREVYNTTFTSSASTSAYGLAVSLARLIGIYDTSNDIALECRDLKWLRQTDPGLGETGESTIYVPLGWAPVHTQPSDASTLYVKSTSASDTTMTARIEGVDSSGVRRTDSKTMTGLTAAAFSTYQFLEVTAFYLTAAPIGDVTLLEDSGSGTELGLIPSGTTSARYFRVQLYPTPTDTITYRVDYLREIEDMVHDTEEPLLPRAFHQMLSLAVQSDEWRRKDDDRHLMVRQDFEQRIRDLNNWLWNLPDILPSRESAGSGGAPVGPMVDGAGARYDDARYN